MKLTEKEEEVMTVFWQHGALTIRGVVALYPEPRPHFNTVSTYVHILEKKGYLSRHKVGNALTYSPAIELEEYRKSTMKGVIRRFFDNSYMQIVSTLVRDEDISVDELKELIRMVEQNKEQKR
ncbi:MAG: BlaI/MecI/CopY family transcriptional regulator [Paramuribaculum sp.]|nr:BlaI/MecI/CopY family transcriptional regulator [Paramuribaculum sp.]